MKKQYQILLALAIGSLCNYSYGSYFKRTAQTTGPLLVRATEMNMPGSMGSAAANRSFVTERTPETNYDAIAERYGQPTLLSVTKKIYQDLTTIQKAEEDIADQISKINENVPSDQPMDMEQTFNTMLKKAGFKISFKDFLSQVEENSTTPRGILDWLTKDFNLKTTVKKDENTGKTFLAFDNASTLKFAKLRDIVDEMEDVIHIQRRADFQKFPNRNEQILGSFGGVLTTLALWNHGWVPNEFFITESENHTPNRITLRSMMDRDLKKNVTSPTYDWPSSRSWQNNPKGYHFSGAKAIIKERQEDASLYPLATIFGTNFKLLKPQKFGYDHTGDYIGKDGYYDQSGNLEEID